MTDTPRFIRADGTEGDMPPDVMSAVLDELLLNTTPTASVNGEILTDMNDPDAVRRYNERHAARECRNPEAEYNASNIGGMQTILDQETTEALRNERIRAMMEPGPEPLRSSRTEHLRESQVWTQFMEAYIQSGTREPRIAAKQADAALAEWDKRFGSNANDIG